MDKIKLILTVNNVGKSYFIENLPDKVRAIDLDSYRSLIPYIKFITCTDYNYTFILMNVSQLYLCKYTNFTEFMKSIFNLISRDKINAVFPYIDKDYISESANRKYQKHSFEEYKEILINQIKNLDEISHTYGLKTYKLKKGEKLTDWYYKYYLPEVNK